MNNRERKAYSILLVIQGSYYFILGLLMLLIQKKQLFYDLPQIAEINYIFSLFGGVLLGIGLSFIFFSKNKDKQNRSISILGFVAAFTFFLHDSVYLYHYDSNSFLWMDLLIQLGILLTWAWLVYWWWIEYKFAKI